METDETMAGAWIAPAAQARSRRTLEAILDATRTLLNERSFDEITIAEICRHAGCTPPALYQRFQDKEALVHAIHEQFTHDVVRLVEQYLDADAWRGQPVSRLIDALVRGLLAIESRSSGLRVTAVRRSHADERFADRIRRMREALYGGLARSLRGVDGLELDSEHDEERAARFLVRMIQGAAVRHYEGPHLESRPPDEEELVEDLIRAALAYLGAPWAAGRNREP